MQPGGAGVFACVRILRGFAHSRHLDIALLRHHDVYMRTTLTLDDDVAQQLTELTHRLRRPFKAVVNDTLRRGLGNSQPAAPKPFRVRPHPLGLKPGLDDRKFNQLLDQLESDRAVAKLKRRK